MPDPREENVRHDCERQIKGIARVVKHKVQETRGIAKQTAGIATGNDRLRREGKVEQLKSNATSSQSGSRTRSSSKGRSRGRAA
jgi:uncharacterized protein YjbJ (UPF0337 family)